MLQATDDDNDDDECRHANFLIIYALEAYLKQVQKSFHAIKSHHNTGSLLFFAAWSHSTESLIMAIKKD